MGMTYAGFGCVDPATFTGPAGAWRDRAGLYRTGPGARPGRGWLLLRKSALDAIDTAADHDLAFSGSGPDHVVTLSPITLLRTECVSPGSPADPDAVHLCEVVDRRHLLNMVPLDRGYNVTKADGTGNLAQTKNGGSDWAWQEVVNDLTTVLGLGALTLPFTPDGAPNNLVFWGRPSALECLCDVLTRLGCGLAYDPAADEFSVARLGDGSDAALDAVAAGRTWDGYGAEAARGYHPRYVRVRFMRRPVDAADGYSPYWFEDVELAAAAGREDGTFVQVDDDLPALGASGTPSNAAALAARAAERAADWLRKRRDYDRPVLRAWVDFLPEASGLGGYAAREVVFDDRGAFQTWARSEPDGALEAWRPQGGWPVWWPLEAPAPGVTGTGTDNHVTRWDGTSAVQDSYAQIADDGTLTVYGTAAPSSTDPFVRLGNATVTGGAQSSIILQPAGSLSTVTIQAGSDGGPSTYSVSLSNGTVSVANAVLSYTAGSGGAGPWSSLDITQNLSPATLTTSIVQMIDGGAGMIPGNPYLTGLDSYLYFRTLSGFNGYLTAYVPSKLSGPYGHRSVFLLHPGDDANFAAFGVRDQGVEYVGETATDGGVQFVGGLRVGGGSGSLAGTGTANTFTQTQTIFSGANVPALDLKQTSSNASNTLQSRNAAGTVTFAATGAGDVTANSFTGSGSGLTNIPAAQLTGTLDGGTY